MGGGRVFPSKSKDPAPWGTLQGKVARQLFSLHSMGKLRSVCSGYETVTVNDSSA